MLECGKACNRNLGSFKQGGGMSNQNKTSCWEGKRAPEHTVSIAPCSISIIKPVTREAHQCLRGNDHLYAHGYEATWIETNGGK